MPGPGPCRGQARTGARFVSPRVCTMGHGIRAVMALDTDGHRFVTEATVSSWKMGDPLGMTITYQSVRK